MLNASRAQRAEILHWICHIHYQLRMWLERTPRFKSSEVGVSFLFIRTSIHSSRICTLKELCQTRKTFQVTFIYRNPSDFGGYWLDKSIWPQISLQKCFCGGFISSEVFPRLSFFPAVPFQQAGGKNKTQRRKWILSSGHADCFILMAVFARH